MGKQRVMGGGVPRARSEGGRSRGDRANDDRPQLSAGRPHLDDKRAQFIAVVSHELRTPLTSIVSFSELLRGEAEGLSADGIRFLEIIERNADRLFTLIDDLLMLNRLEAGGLPLELTDCLISGLAAEAVRNAQPLAAKVGGPIPLDAGDGPLLPADPRRLRQVLAHPTSNAAQFSN